MTSNYVFNTDVRKNGYLNELRQLSDLQQKFLDFLQETEAYTISIRP
jgi:hypothetical protein